MQTHVLIRESLFISLCSFWIGTGLLVWFFFSGNQFVAALYSAAALLLIGCVNLYCMLRLLWQGQQQLANRQQFFSAAALMCLNIPAALLYAKLVGVLFNALVVRLVNDTGQPLTQVVIVGCTTRPLADLGPNQSTFLWLPITESCIERSVLVQYTANGLTRQAVINGYVLEGQRITCRLGIGPSVATAR